MMDIATIQTDLLDTSHWIQSRNRGIINRGKWSNYDARSRALREVNKAQEEFVAFVSNLGTYTSVDPKVSEVSNQVDRVMAAAAKTILISTRNPMLLRAKLQGLTTRVNEIRTEEMSKLEQMEPDEQRTTIMEELIEAADATVSFFQDLIDHPLQYQNLASKLLRLKLHNVAKMVTSDVSGNTATINAREIIEKLFGPRPNGRLPEIEMVRPRDSPALPNGPQLPAQSEKFITTSRFLTLIQVGLIVVTVVLDTIADSENWGPTFAKSTLAVGIGFGAGIAASFVATSAMNSLWVAAGATAEAPPVAAFLLATGIMIGVGIGIVELSSLLIDTLFGTVSIPPNLRVEMTMEMSAPMADEMFVSLNKGIVG